MQNPLKNSLLSRIDPILKRDTSKQNLQYLFHDKTKTNKRIQ